MASMFLTGDENYDIPQNSKQPVAHQKGPVAPANGQYFPSATVPVDNQLQEAEAGTSAGSSTKNSPRPPAGTEAGRARVPTKPIHSKRVFKVIVIGDAGVGKTCLSFRFCNGRFPERTEATIGVDFRERAITIDGELIRVQLWDTAGQERFRQSMVGHYYRNVNAVVFVYDVTSAKSFKDLQQWISECEQHAVTPGQLPMILVGNKCDLKTEAAVGTNEAQKWADTKDMPVFETSAKADSEADHVEAIFMTLVHKLRASKPIHVQTQEEQAAAEESRIIRVKDQLNQGADADEGYCGAC